ncbi:proteinral transcription repressor [Rhodotorula kratochvilovae]
MIHTHASELNAMRSMVYDLERKYHDDKRVLQEENSRLQEENSRLRQQLDSSRSSISSSGAAAGGSSISGPPGRPSLPPMISPAPGARPGSAGVFAGRDGERDFAQQGQGGPYGPGGANGRERDGSVAGEHPNKRLRTDDEERRKSELRALRSISLSAWERD